MLRYWNIWTENSAEEIKEFSEAQLFSLAIVDHSSLLLVRLRNSVAKRSSLKTHSQPEWPPLASVRGHSNLALCLLHVIAFVEDIGDLLRLHINIRSEFLWNQVFGQRGFGVKFVSCSTPETQPLWNQELGKGKVFAEFCGVHCLHNKYWGCNATEWRVLTFVATWSDSPQNSLCVSVYLNILYTRDLTGIENI